jgi:hypothetical protein
MSAIAGASASTSRTPIGSPPAQVTSLSISLASA